MKIDAKVEFSPAKEKELNRSWFRIPVDIDYVEDNESSVNEWVANELEEAFGRKFMLDDFTVTNMDEVLEEIKFDEFDKKAN